MGNKPIVKTSRDYIYKGYSDKTKNDLIADGILKQIRREPSVATPVYRPEVIFELFYDMNDYYIRKATNYEYTNFKVIYNKYLGPLMELKLCFAYVMFYRYDQGKYDAHFVTQHIELVSECCNFLSSCSDCKDKFEIIFYLESDVYAKLQTEIVEEQQARKKHDVESKQE